MQQYGRDKVELLLQFVKASKEINYLAFGVDNKSQLLENIKAFEADASIKEEWPQD